MNAFIRIDRWDDIPAAITKMRQAGAEHRVPLMQALYQGRIAHLEVQRTGTAGQFKLWSAAARLPAIALAGDDDHAERDGPDTWPLARRMFRWTKFVLVHGGTGHPSHYEYAVTLAEQYRRLVLIECASARIPDWEAAAERWARDATGLVMRPPPGVVHPDLSKREAVH